MIGCVDAEKCCNWAATQNQAGSYWTYKAGNCSIIPRIAGAWMSPYLYVHICIHIRLGVDSYMHTHLFRHTLICIHMQLHLGVDLYTHTYTFRHTIIHIHIYWGIHSYIHMHLDIRSCTYTSIEIYAHTHTCIEAYTHAHTHIHISHATR